MKVRVEKSVCVITPTLGNSCLDQSIESVEKQTYGNITHLIVGDGPGTFDAIINNGRLSYSSAKLLFTFAPYQTGKNGFYGHRIYAAFPHLVDHDYICFLDDDNWYEPNHVQSLVDKIEENRLDWAYSLRKVWYDTDENGIKIAEKQFLDHDCCESIGKWPIYFTQKTDAPAYLVDTSSYCFRREFLIQVCNHWHSGWGGDRRFLHIITKQMGHNNYDTTGLFTLNYLLPNMQEAYGGDMGFFRRGNEEVKQYYGGKYPWE